MTRQYRRRSPIASSKLGQIKVKNLAQVSKNPIVQLRSLTSPRLPLLAHISSLTSACSNLLAHLRSLKSACSPIPFLQFTSSTES
ncbi:hypothetical protein PtB15_18B282 [Puccinia triticina]|nr:hypothetical protein PtB15_18B282 [Puccinia triticina]